MDAAKDHGQILSVEDSISTRIITNRTGFAEHGSHRGATRWRAAIQEVVNHLLIEQQDLYGNGFVLTKLGYDIADLIESRL